MRTAILPFGMLPLAAVLLVHCDSQRPASQGWRAEGTLIAPPRPGSSITHTKLCECTSCSPARCCDGETVESAQRTCKDSYDFSAPGCAMSIASCTGRCSKFVWRVPLDATCDETPSACCG